MDSRKIVRKEEKIERTIKLQFYIIITKHELS